MLGRTIAAITLALCLSITAPASALDALVPDPVAQEEGVQPGPNLVHDPQAPLEPVTLTGTAAADIPHGWWDLGPGLAPANHSVPVVLFSALWYPSEPDWFLFWMFDATTGTFAICDTSPYDYWEGEPDDVQALRIVNDPTVLTTPEPLESGVLTGVEETCSHAADQRGGALETWRIETLGLCGQATPCAPVPGGLVGEFSVMVTSV